MVSAWVLSPKALVDRWTTCCAAVWKCSLYSTSGKLYSCKLVQVKATIVKKKIILNCSWHSCLSLVWDSNFVTFEVLIAVLQFQSFEMWSYVEGIMIFKTWELLTQQHYHILEGWNLQQQIHWLLAKSVSSDMFWMFEFIFWIIWFIIWYSHSKEECT